VKNQNFTVVQRSEPSTSKHKTTPYGLLTIDLMTPETEETEVVKTSPILKSNIITPKESIQFK
jgi:hypothetical protein